MRSTAYLALFGMWLLFIVSGLIAALFCLGAVLAGKRMYPARILRAMDRVAAALLGWDGTNTVSYECGGSDCRFCKALCWIANLVLEADHCRKQRI